MFDLSDWASNERWSGWLDLEISHLSLDYISLITMIPTPVHRTLKEERCWGKTGCYLVKVGYRAVDVDYRSNNNDRKWKNIWNKDGLPKINVLF